MGEVIIQKMDLVAIGKVARLEEELKKLPQIELHTSHLVHGGMYARSITLQAGTLITGALIKVPTILIISGKCIVFLGNDTVFIDGYKVIPASEGTKRAFFTCGETHMTMLFSTPLKDIEDIEKELTNEFESLASRNPLNKNTLLLSYKDSE